MGKERGGMILGNTSIPVTVFPSPHHGGLAITRTLGRLGIPVFNIDASPWCPAFFSRYSKGRFLQHPGAESPEWLLQVGRSIGARSILVPTTDSAARFVADHAARLAERFVLPPQNPDLVHAFLSKKDMTELARWHGVPAPATLFPRTRADFLAAPESVGFPLMVKAISGDTLRRDSRSKVLVRTMAQFLELCAQVSDAALPDLMVQELIPGGEDTVWMFNGYFDGRSECRAGFTGRKLRQCPVYTGVASLGVCEQNAEVDRCARRFMKALGYSGIVDIDFRYDARDGEYKILDVNPRIGSTFRLFVSAGGLDVARAMYLDLTGQSAPESATPSGRKWVVEDLDVVASLGYAKRGALTLAEWLKSVRGIDEFSFLAWDDPLPAALMLRADLGELFPAPGSHADDLPPFAVKPAPAEKQLCL